MSIFPSVLQLAHTKLEPNEVRCSKPTSNQLGARCVFWWVGPCLSCSLRIDDVCQQIMSMVRGTSYSYAFEIRFSALLT